MKGILFLLILIATATSQSLTFSFTNRSINAITTYEATITRLSTVAISSTDSITLQFPVDSYSSTQLQSVACSPACTVSAAAAKLTVSGSLLNSTSSTIKLSIMNIGNPPSAKSPVAYLASWSSSAGTVIENYTYYFGGFDSGTLKSCSIVFSPNTVSTVGIATFTIVPGNPLLAGGSLAITFPTKWANTITNDTVINASSSTLNCTSNSSVFSSLSCANLLTGSIFVSTVAIKTNESFSLSISSIRSPPVSIADATTMVASYSSNSDLIDSNSPCTVSIASASPLTITLVDTTAKVASTFSPTFRFTTTNAITAGDVLKITILTTNITSTNSATINITVIDGNSYTDTSSLNTNHSNIASGIYGYLMKKVIWKTYIDVNLVVTISGLSFKAPPNNQTISGFRLSLFRSNYLYSQGDVDLMTSANTLANVTVTAQNPLVNANTQYTFVFTTSSPLTSKGWLQIILPYDIISSSYTTQRCANAAGSNVSASAMCALANGTVTVTNLFSGAIPANTQITVKFTGVTNPGSTKPSGAFTVTTFYDQRSFMTDQISTLVFAASADTISSCSVSRNNDTVGIDAVYTFTYTVKNTLPANASIIIGIPSTILAYSNTTVYISVNGSTFQLKTSVLIGSTVQQINITQPYLIATAVGTVLTIRLTSLRNPNSAKQPSSFSLSSYDGTYIVEQITSGVAVGTATSGTFKQAAIASSSGINGESTSYILSFQSSVNYSANSTLRLSVPTQIKVATTQTCTPNSGFTSSSTFTCTVSGNQILITLPEAISTSSIYKISLSNLTNPRTYTTSSTFNLTSLVDNSSSIDSSLITGVTNNQANTIVSLTSTVINPSQSFLSSNQTIQFSVTTKNALTATDYIELTYPSRYVYNGSGNGSACMQSNFNCIPNSNNQLKVKISCSTFSSNLSFVFDVTGYRSPNTTATMTDYFVLNTFDSSGNPIDITNTSRSSTQTTFSLTCSYPCEQCNLAIGKTTCTTCYVSPISSENYLQNGTCVSTCGKGFFPLGPSAACTSCISPCDGCTGSATNCTSCLSTSTSKYYNGSACVQTCASGTYAQLSGTNWICSTCQNNCTTCTSATNCTTCTSPRLFYLNQCLLVCPQGFYAGTTSCLTCDVSCKNCSESATNCVVCSDNYARLTTNSTCSTDCGTKVAYQGTCQCDSSCSACKGTITNCTSCNILDVNYPYYYLTNGSGKCVSKCPDGLYVEVGVCTVCNTNCTTCNSKFQCTSCTSPYVLFNGTCSSACPSGYYNLSSKCTACSTSCMTCSSSSELCTSCGSNLSLSGTQCVANCSNNSVSLPITIGGRGCIACTSNCLTCSGLVSNCTSCITNTNLYLNSCLLTCPATTVSIGYQCLSCVSPCQTCSLTQSSCLTCRSLFFSIKSTNSSQVNCVSDCTVAPYYLFTNGSECIQCQTPCFACSKTAFNCTSCNSTFFLQVNNCVDKCSNGFYQYQRKCLSTCPENYTGYNGVCTNETIQNMTVALEAKSIPIPFTLASLVAAISIAVARFVSPQTFIPSMAVALFAVIETVSWIVTLALVATVTQSTLVHQAVICLAVAIALHLLINLIAIVFFFRYIRSDETFTKWYSRFATICVKIVTYFFGSINHKFLNMIFSKCFGSAYFKAPLSSPALFTPLLICIGLSFVPEVLAIAGCSLGASDPNTLSTSQLYMQCIDAIIVTILTIICSIWNMKKPVDFYESTAVEKYEVRSEINNNYTVEELNEHLGRQQLVAEPGRKPTYEARLRPQSAANRKLIKASHRITENMSKEVEGGAANPISIIRKKHENGQVGFSDTSSEFVSESNDNMAVAPELERDLDFRYDEQQSSNVQIKAKKPHPSKHRIPSDIDHDSQEDQSDKAVQEQKLEESIVNKLMIDSASASQLSSNQIPDQMNLEKQATALLPVENASQQPPGKPHSNVTLPIKLIVNTQIDNSEYVGSEIQHNDQGKTVGFSIDRRFDLEIEDITDYSEEVPRVPSFQTGRTRPEAEVLNLNTYKSSKLGGGRYEKPNRVKTQRPINTSTSVLNEPPSQELVPSKPQFLKHSNIESQKTRLDATSQQFRGKDHNTEQDVFQESYGNNIDVSPSNYNQLNQRRDELPPPLPRSNLLTHTDQIRKRVATLGQTPQKSMSLEQGDIISNLNYQQMLAPQSRIPPPAEYNQMSKTAMTGQFYSRGRAQNQVTSNKVRSLQRIYLHKIDGKRSKITTDRKSQPHKNDN